VAFEWIRITDEVVFLGANGIVVGTPYPEFQQSLERGAAVANGALEGKAGFPRWIKQAEPLTMDEPSTAVDTIRQKARYCVNAELLSGN
jgi:hypothetical protein